jgi:mono/diheme cytochrome c family protein
MTSRFGGLLLAAACGVASAAGPAKGTAKPEPMPVFDKKYLSNAAVIKAGKQVWESQCRHCHGAAAYPGKAPKLNPGMLEPDFIYDRVTYGFGKMPGWKEVFSLEQRKSVVAYVKSPGFSP